MRVMALDAPAALDIVGIGCGMLVPVWPGDVAVTIFTNAGETVGLILICSLGEPVTTQAGHSALQDRVVRTAHEPKIGVFVATTAELGLVIEQKTDYGSWGMELVAVRTVYLLQCVHIEPVAVHVLMGKMASGTGGERFVAGQRRGVRDGRL